MNPALIVIISVLAFLILSFTVYLILIKPRKKRTETEKYKSVKFAHRGLHGNGRAENSISAFRAAIDAGFGIELDVRLSKDGRLVVFHDATLERVTDAEDRVIDRTAEELSQISLSGTSDTIPTLDEVLSLVDGRVPLLVEIKEDVGEQGVAEAAVKTLSHYKGEFIVESFNPLALSVFKKEMPTVIRGFLSQSFAREKKHKGFIYFLLENLLTNIICRPDFIAYNHIDYKNCALKLARGMFGATTLAWTVRSQKEEQAAYEHGFDSVIFENYIPDKR